MGDSLWDQHIPKFKPDFRAVLSDESSRALFFSIHLARSIQLPDADEFINWLKGLPEMLVKDFVRYAMCRLISDVYANPINCILLTSYPAQDKIKIIDCMLGLHRRLDIKPPSGIHPILIAALSKQTEVFQYLLNAYGDDYKTVTAGNIMLYDAVTNCGVADIFDDETKQFCSTPMKKYDLVDCLRTPGLREVYQAKVSPKQEAPKQQEAPKATPPQGGRNWGRMPYIALFSVGALGILYLLSKTSLSTYVPSVTSVVKMPSAIMTYFSQESGGPSLGQ